MGGAVGAHDGRRSIPGAEARDGLAEMAYDGSEPTTELNSSEEDFRSSAKAVYSQVRPVDLQREQAGFSRLHRTLDFMQLLQAFLRGCRCLCLGPFTVVMAHQLNCVLQEEDKNPLSGRFPMLRRNK